jgi:hypothetical protein
MFHKRFVKFACFLVSVPIIFLSPGIAICSCPPSYNFKLDYVKSTRYNHFIFEDEFTNEDTFDLYTPLVGSLSRNYLDTNEGVLNLNSSDSISVPWGTDYDCKTQQEFAIPSLIEGPWDGNYQIIARFKASTVDDLIPDVINGIETSYDVVIARNNPFTAANGNVCSRGIEFTKVFHNPNTDRDEVETIATIDWENVTFKQNDPVLSIRIDLNVNGNVEAFYSTDREKTWYSIGIIYGFPDTDFQGRIITSANGNEL